MQVRALAESRIYVRSGWGARGVGGTLIALRPSAERLTAVVVQFWT